MHSYCVYNYQKLPSRTYWNPARSATSLQQIENTGWHISRHNSASFLMWINLNVDLQVVCTNHLKNVYWSAQSAPCSEQPANTLQTINIAFQRALETEGQLYRERGKKFRTCKVGGFSNWLRAARRASHRPRPTPLLITRRAPRPRTVPEPSPADYAPRAMRRAPRAAPRTAPDPLPSW